MNALRSLSRWGRKRPQTPFSCGALSIAALAAAILVPLSARADTVRDPEGATAEIAVAPPPIAIPDRPEPRAPRGFFMNLSLGARGTLIPNRGFDPYAKGNMLGQLSVAAGPTLVTVGPVSFSALAQWDVGSVSNVARGETSSLTVHRLSVGLESRFQVVRRLGFFVKVAPGAMHLRGRIDDPAVPRPLVARPWTYSLDTTGGIAFMFASSGPREAPTSRWWLTGEGGYGFAGIAEMAYAPVADDEDPRRYGSIALPPLKAAGPIGRLAVGVTF